MIQQKRQGTMNDRRYNNVVIIQHQDDLMGKKRYIVQQGNQHGFNCGRLGSMQQSKSSSAQIRLELPERRNTVAPEAHEIIIAFIQRQPGDRERILSNPLAQYSRLT